MNKNQINKERMYLAINLLLDNFSASIASYPELMQAQQNLKSFLDLIEQNRQIQETDNKGLTLNKTKLREDLMKLIQQFSAALLAHAIATKNVQLKTKASYKHSALLRAADPILYDIGMLLYTLATPLEAELARFFITRSEYDRLLANLNNFKAAIPQKRLASGTSKVSTAYINDTFIAIDDLLKNELDVLLMPFQFTQPDFYNEYRSARNIVDTGGNRKTKKEETTVA